MAPGHSHPFAAIQEGGLLFDKRRRCLKKHVRVSKGSETEDWIPERTYQHQTRKDKRLVVMAILECVGADQLNYGREANGMATYLAAILRRQFVHLGLMIGRGRIST